MRNPFKKQQSYLDTNKQAALCIACGKWMTLREAVKATQHRYNKISGLVCPRCDRIDRYDAKR